MFIKNSLELVMELEQTRLEIDNAINLQLNSLINRRVHYKGYSGYIYSINKENNKITIFLDERMNDSSILVLSFNEFIEEVYGK